jgi:hypothetical protein
VVKNDGRQRIEGNFQLDFKRIYGLLWRVKNVRLFGRDEPAISY